MAERYFPEDPNTCLLKLRQLAELLAQLTATRVGSYVSSDEKQFELLQRLERQGILTREVAQLFFEVRKAGNDANHALQGDHRTALACLKITRQLGIWYHRTFTDRDFKPGPFIPPFSPKDENAQLKAELQRLRSAFVAHEAAYAQTAEELAATRARWQVADSDRLVWEQLASEAEEAKAALATKLAELQVAGAAQPAAAVTKLVTAADQASREVELDEADTRVVIDAQLKMWGWEADSRTLTYANGVRPEKGKSRAIAEWPTTSGPADYVLFIGFMPVAAVEAKRKNIDVRARLGKRSATAADSTSPKGWLRPVAPGGSSNCRLHSQATVGHT